GHDLIRLLSECQSVALRIGIECDLTFTASPTKLSILNLLNDYARNLRYHNLDSLAGRSTATDPLQRWNDIVLCVYSTEVPERRRESEEAIANAFAAEIGDAIICVQHDLAQNRMTVTEAFLVPRIFDLSAPYIVCHLIDVIQEINKVQFAVESR